MTPSREDLARTLARSIASSSSAPLPIWATTAFWEDAAVEGVLPLIAAAVGACGWEGVPDDVRADALRRTHEEAARAELSGRDLRRVLAAFNRQSIPALVLKGTALGYTHYGGLANRPRLDVDLLIRRDDIGRVHEIFRSLEAEYVPHVTGRFVMSQFHYVTTDRAGCRHAYDVHWRIVNGHRFAGALSFDEMFADAAAPEALGAVRGRVPSPIHALLLACIHRAAHHAARGPLVWLYDLHLLTERLDARERQAVLEIAAGRGLAGIAAHSLAEAGTTFGGGAVAALAAELRDRGGDRAGVHRFLESRGSRARALLDDLTVLDGWRSRAALVREVLFPPAAYMRHAYAPGSAAPLGLLYLRRAVRGAAGFLGVRQRGRQCF
jgi:hypothetical protein